MDDILIPLLIINLAAIITLAIRSLYWGWKFVFTIGIKNPEKARKYRIAPERSWGPIEMRSAVYSKEPCDDMELESLRIRARKAGNHFVFSLIPFPFIILGFIIPRLLKIKSFSITTPASSQISMTMIIWVIFIFLISVASLILVTCLRRKNGK